jgi:hypothetical protein
MEIRVVFNVEKVDSSLKLINVRTQAMSGGTKLDSWAESGVEHTSVADLFTEVQQRVVTCLNSPLIG